jgi:hypothetical protein
MRACAAQSLKDTRDDNAAGLPEQEFTGANKECPVKLAVIADKSAELLPKELVCCIMATD